METQTGEVTCSTSWSQLLPKLGLESQVQSGVFPILLSHTRAPLACGPLSRPLSPQGTKQAVALGSRTLFSCNRTFRGWKWRKIHGSDVKGEKKHNPSVSQTSRVMWFYLIVELWILVVMRDDSISICGKNRSCRFSINTLQKKETVTTPHVGLLNMMLWNHIQLEASVSLRPRPSHLALTVSL